MMPAALSSYIATRDRRIAKLRGYDLSPMHKSFAQLLERGCVNVGGRASCGSPVDPTWVELMCWNEIVRKARRLGYAIEEISLKQDNAWATKSGGFWQESEYRISSTTAAIGAERKHA